MQMIASAFNYKNLKTAFLLEGAKASRSRAISIDVPKVRKFSSMVLKVARQKPHILAQASDCARSFCDACIRAPKIRTNHESQAIFALNFHPCIGLPSSRMRSTADMIATVSAKKLSPEHQKSVLRWLVKLPRDVLLSVVRAWIQHLTWSWLAQHSPDDTRRNARGPLSALHWVRLLHWACRVQHRDARGSKKMRGSFLNESDFYAPLISRQLNISRFLTIRYSSMRNDIIPSSAYVNHAYLFDAPAKAQMMRSEAKRLWNHRPRNLSTDNKIVELHISTLQLPRQLCLEVRRDRALNDAIDQLASISMAEQIQMQDARTAAVESVRSDTPGVLSGTETEEQKRARVQEVREHIGRLMDMELFHFFDMCFEVPMKVRFRGEPGVDEGGLSRHFFELVARQACTGPDPLFVQRHDSSPCVWFPGFRDVDEYLASCGELDELDPALKRYQWFGVIIGLAVKTRCQMQINLPTVLFEFLQHERDTPPVTSASYKSYPQADLSGPVLPGRLPRSNLDRFPLRHVMRNQPQRSHLTTFALSRGTADTSNVCPALRQAAEEIDPELLRGIDALLEYEDTKDPDAVRDVFCLDHTVTLERKRAPSEPTPGSPETLGEISLIPYLPKKGTHAKRQSRHNASAPGKSDRMNDPVTASNRALYAHALLTYHVHGAHIRRIHAIRSGFRRIVRDYHTVGLCSPAELRIAICGEYHIKVDNIRMTVRYAGGYDARSPPVRWLFEVLASFSQAELRAFHLFVTGSSAAPCGAFVETPITIQRNTSDDTRFPSAHTCFNQLLLPHYTSKSILKERLLFAITSCTDFGLL